jgi:hypothetical protein
MIRKSLFVIISILVFCSPAMAIGNHYIAVAPREGSTFEITVTGSLVAGQFSTLTGKTITVYWGDGTSESFTGTNQAYSHNYGSGGTRTMFIVSQVPALTKVTQTTAASGYAFALSDMPSTMLVLNLGGTESAITGALVDLPRGMTYMRLNDTDSVITGLLTDAPSLLATLYLAYTSATSITGSLGDLSAAMQYLHLGGTSSTITAGAVQLSCTGIRSLWVNGTSMSQANVDGILERLYTDRTLFTYATPTLDISGTNSAPSGTYQDGDPPTTGKEYAYELENDPETEGFNVWAIDFTP